MKEIKCGSCGNKIGEIVGCYLYAGEQKSDKNYLGKYQFKARGHITCTCNCGNIMEIDTELNRRK